MSDSPKSDLDALNLALKALGGLQVAINLVGERLASLQREARIFNLHLDPSGKLTGLSYRSEPDRAFSAEGDDFICVRSDAEWLLKYVDELWKSHALADQALSLLPRRLKETLDGLAGRPWLSSVRRHCLDQILAWPGETHHQTSYAAIKVHGNINELLEKAADNDPFPTWANYGELIKGYASDLFAIRDVALPDPETVEAGTPPGIVSAPDIDKKIQQSLPDNVDVRDLCKLLEQNREQIRTGQKTEIGVAREMSKEAVGNCPKADGWLRQARRYPHLWK